MPEERLQLWLDTRCMAHPRLMAGGKTLLRDFNEWNRVVALTRGAFMEAIENRGFQNVEVEGTWLVLGVCLKEDADLCLGGRASA